MNAPALFGPNRKRLPVGTLLGRGGEGEVYALTDGSAQAVKVYGQRAPERQEKIAAMVSAALAAKTALVAFPLEVVTDDRGRFAGFTMRRVEAHKPIHELYAPGARKAEFPKADYRFLVRTALNVARAIASVHNTGCVIGDINHSGILVSPTATVALIDADSFQVTAGAIQYLCKVGVPEYTPPELQGRRLDTVTRTPNHDAFGLAVILFQLLWMGRHPYSGRYAQGEMPLEKAIAESRFAYSASRQTGMTPPPATPSLQDLPGPLRNAFEIAFSPGANRPPASEWVRLLDDFERSLRHCSRVQAHYHGPDAQSCPWCRMEQTLGVELFPSAVPTQVAQTVGDGPTSIDLAAVWRAIEAIAGPSAIPQTPTFATASKPAGKSAKAARGGLLTRRLAGGGLVVGSMAIAFGFPHYWWLGAAGGAWGAYLIFTLTTAARQVYEEATKSCETYAQALRNWYADCSIDPFQEAKAELGADKEELTRLPADEKQQLDAYMKNRRAEQLKAYLQLHTIRGSKIRGIGPAKVATLTSYGIDTAYDVSHARVIAVPGFGPVHTGSLVSWRAALEGRFVFNPNSNQLDRARMDAIRSAFARRTQELRASLSSGPARLRRLATEIEQRRARTTELAGPFELHQQGTADLKAIGRRPALLPKAPAPAPVSPKRRPTVYTGTLVAPSGQANPPRSLRATAGSPSPLSQPRPCPQCGSTMVLRTASRGTRRGYQFWGCSQFPRCTGIRPK